MLVTKEIAIMSSLEISEQKLKRKKEKKRRRPPLCHILGKTHSNFKAETPWQCNTANAIVLFCVDPVKQSLLPETTSTKTMCSVVFTFLTYCLNFRRRGYVAETE